MRACRRKLRHLCGIRRGRRHRRVGPWATVGSGRVHRVFLPGPSLVPLRPGSGGHCRGGRTVPDAQRTACHACRRSPMRQSARVERRLLVVSLRKRKWKHERRRGVLRVPRGHDLHPGRDHRSRRRGRPWRRLLRPGAGATRAWNGLRGRVRSDHAPVPLRSWRCHRASEDAPTSHALELTPLATTNDLPRRRRFAPATTVPQSPWPRAGAEPRSPSRREPRTNRFPQCGSVQPVPRVGRASLTRGLAQVCSTGWPRRAPTSGVRDPARRRSWLHARQGSHWTTSWLELIIRKANEWRDSRRSPASRQGGVACSAVSRGKWPHPRRRPQDQHRGEREVTRLRRPRGRASRVPAMRRSHKTRPRNGPAGGP